MKIAPQFIPTFISLDYRTTFRIKQKLVGDFFWRDGLIEVGKKLKKPTINGSGLHVLDKDGPRHLSRNSGQLHGTSGSIEMPSYIKRPT